MDQASKALLQQGLGAAYFYRRNLDQYPADQAHWMVNEREALRRLCSLWEMVDANLHCRAEMSWPDRTLHRRCADEQPHLRSLDRDPACSDAVAWRCRHSRQCRLPQKRARAEQLVKAKGAWLLFLPYSPDLNPIEMAFSKLKALLRKRAARSFDTITQALGDVINLFSAAECRNFFKAAGYEAE